MLTIKNVNAELAKTYFEKGYYEEGRWFGEGAASLNLTGEIKDHDPYNNLLDGQSPDGNHCLMGRKIKGNQHRAAIDCTFNAPKSVSLQALVGGDERLIEAHRKAVNQTLELMESRYAQSRILKKGQPRQVVQTGKLAVAQFDHIETRDLDPHLHTHCVVMNVTQREDGQWRSLHNDAIYRQQKLLGMVYQHNLALELMKLGYQVEAKQHGQFEIAGYEKKDLEFFSKRRQQILAEAGENASVLERNIAWGNTRVKKEVVSPEQLKQKWQREASELGVKFVNPNTGLDKKGDGNSEQREQREQRSRGSDNQTFQGNIDQNAISQPSPIKANIVNDAIAHCEERAVAFRLEDVEKFILLNGQPINIESLDKTIGQHSQLINVNDNLNRRYTTETALQRELATIRLMLEGKNQQCPIYSEGTINQALAPISLTEGQQEAITTALSTHDTVMAWQGVAGAGKTYALNHFTTLSKKNGYNIKGFAPSAEAAKVLGFEVGIETDTVASKLYSKSSQPIEDNQIWIVDEAGLLSAKAAYELLKRAKAEKARVLLVGDTRQLSAVEAGNPFKSLQAAGMTTARMNQSLRQRTPELQTAVDFISKGEIDAGFGILNQANCLIEVAEEEKINKIVNDYLKIPQADREKTLILAGTNAERLAITQSIRQGLKAEKKLGEGVKLTQLKSKDLTRVQMRFTHHLEIGDLVSPAFNYKQRQLSKGELYEIIDKDVDSLTLKDSTENRVKVDPLFEKAVYRSSEIEIAAGDRLKWTKNDRKQGRRNGQEFTVKAIEGTKATIEYKDGQQDSFDLSVPQHLDYGLVSTTYSSQGKTADRVLISADYTVGKESFYVAVSRVKSDLKLYTSDKDNLLDLAKASRAKENPLELLRARQKALFKGKYQTKERGADGKEVSSLTTQPSSVSVVEWNPNVSNLPQKKQSNTVSSVPSNKKPIRDNDEKLIDNFNQINNEKSKPLEKKTSQSVKQNFEIETKINKDLTNQIYESVSQSKMISDEKIETNNDTILSEVTESETGDDTEIINSSNQVSKLVSEPLIISEEADAKLNKKLKELLDTLAKSNQLSDENQQRLQELAERLEGDKKPKQTTEKKGVKKQPIQSQASSSPTPKQTVEPSHNQPDPSKKTLPTPSSEQRLADLNNNRAMRSIILLMRWLNPKPKNSLRTFEGNRYIFHISTDEQTIELYAKDGRGLILQKKDGVLRGNLNEEDVKRMALITSEIEKRLNKVNQQNNRQSQQRSRDNGLSL